MKKLMMLTIFLVSCSGDDHDHDPDTNSFCGITDNNNGTVTMDCPDGSSVQLRKSGPHLTFKTLGNDECITFLSSESVNWDDSAAYHIDDTRVQHLLWNCVTDGIEFGVKKELFLVYLGDSCFALKGQLITKGCNEPVPYPDFPIVDIQIENFIVSPYTSSSPGTLGFQYSYDIVNNGNVTLFGGQTKISYDWKSQGTGGIDPLQVGKKTQRGSGSADGSYYEGQAIQVDLEILNVNGTVIANETAFAVVTLN